MPFIGETKEAAIALEREFTDLISPDYAIEQWFVGHGVDGFNVMPPVLPHGLEMFVDEVVPLLQRRGIFRNAYSGRTLREHYGLRGTVR